MNRGPGDIPAANGQAKQTRQILSHTQNSAKKHKIERDAAGLCGSSMVVCAKVVGGTGLVNAGYLYGRNGMGPRGRPIGEQTSFAIDKVFGPQAQAAEQLVRHNQVLPKYNIGPQVEIGTNNSPRKFDEVQCVAIGLKNSLRGPLDVNRALRIADMGVNIINQVEAELTNQYQQDWIRGGMNGNPPAAPTEDEIKSAAQLAILLAWNNRNRPQGGRKPANRDYTDIRNI